MSQSRNIWAEESGRSECLLRGHPSGFSGCSVVKLEGGGGTRRFVSSAAVRGTDN